MGTERDTVKLKLDIDKGHDPGGAYPYPWRPETGNLMYCMPKVGTRVSLYFPGFDEKDAFVVNCIRTNGASCERMSDPSKRSFTTEHGKELNLYPDEMSLVGGGGNALRMVDDAGLSITTSKQLSITGASVSLSAPKINLSASMEMKLLNRAGSGITLCRDIHVKARERVFLAGTVHEILEQFDDAPQEEFDWHQLCVNVLAGLAVVAVVAALCAVAAALAAAAVAAVTGMTATTAATAVTTAVSSVAANTMVSGSIAVAYNAGEDMLSQQVGDTREYTSDAISGTVSGVVPGIGIPAVSALFKEFKRPLGKIGYTALSSATNAAGGVAGGRTSAWIDGEEYTTQRGIEDATFGALTGIACATPSLIGQPTTQQLSEEIKQLSRGAIKGKMKELGDGKALVRELNSIYHTNCTSINEFKRIIEDNPEPFVKALPREFKPLGLLEENAGNVSFQLLRMNLSMDEYVEIWIEAMMEEADESSEE